MAPRSDARCWICGAAADSREHKFKKSDLVRAYGPGPYRGTSEIALFQRGNRTEIPGPGSRRAQYSPSVCRECNTTWTQPFDRAYDIFLNCLWANEPLVLRRRYVDWRDVYGDDFESGQRNLYKYFAKAFGCRLVDAGASVPRDVVTLLAKRKFRTALRLTLAISEEILSIPDFKPREFIGKGDLIAWARRKSPSKPYGYTWHEQIGWLLIYYWYAMAPDGGLGSTWIADTRFVYLGSRNLSSGETGEMINPPPDLHRPS